MPIIDTDLPENALLNVRNEVHLYFGDSNKVDQRLIDSFIDDFIKRLHRKWHPSWTGTYFDTDVPITGTLQLPTDLKHLRRITNQSDDPETFYKLNGDYYKKGFESSTSQRRSVQWRTAPSTALAVRIWYYRKPIRAFNDQDLVDIDPDAVDIVRQAARVEYEGQRGNLNEFDRQNGILNDMIKDWIDDDFDVDNDQTSRPFNADMTALDFDEGEPV